MDDLLRCVKGYLEGDLLPERFSYDFLAMYVSHFDDGDLAERYIDALDDISEACGWYEPNPDHRKDYKDYIGEEELKQVVQEKYQAIKSLLDKST
ncbi:hypothetical protein GFC29_1378 [Anoxybacillus sp. B7M1]|jgi:hypothetical protein|uniref:Colicin D immunity protein domain-containing protein n=1 Tax=Anoxybacteroides rupiense TaxID=311460 RepID=A0ABD5IX92_9BACL|nr:MULTISPECIES: hypothetical protein [Anoxybacillus]ANB58178.1 hypothetical protein GFC28_246 [Anoxybacillus sp. B2M1]ANB62734.1 hypothetical protein GFC29_1378 [Anoxybacillus sp. B7M1]MBS2772776.1 hypothetical protein [Anoxybacillus rupiensis]MED5052970.1 hypothetical protein [Anoxybacillus rupiensis]